MKILICTGIYPPDIGGPATYSKALFDELPKAGIGVEVLSFGAVRRLPKVLRHFVYFLKALKMAKKADIVFAQDPVSVGLPSCLAAKLAGKKFILKVVGDYAWEQYQNQKSNLKNQNDNAKIRNWQFITPEEFQDKKFDFKTEMRRKIQKFTARRAKTIIVPSDYLKKIILKWGVKEEKIKVVYNTFNTPEISLTKEETRKKLGLNGTILVSAGRLVPWKGFGALIEIMPELTKKIPDLKLYIVGDGPNTSNLKSQISNLGMQEKIILTGQLSHNEVMNYLKAGDIFILNTGYEGFSHFLLEAMAMEIPIITTNVGGNVELIENGNNGILTEYNDKEAIQEAIKKLHNDGGLRWQFVENAKKKIKQFSKEKMMEETVAVLKQ